MATDDSPAPAPDPQPGKSPPENPQVPEDLIGSRIAQKRMAKGLNHDGLSKLTKLSDEPSRAGISRTTIRGYEVGLYKPGTRELRLLSVALEVSPTWLIFGDSNDPNGLGESLQAGAKLPQSELQKLIVALHLLRQVESSEREVVYSVLHSIARLKLGENEYRASIMPVVELAALVGDMWADMKEGKPVDQEKMTELGTAYLPLFEEIAQKEFGKKLSDLKPKS